MRRIAILGGLGLIFVGDPAIGQEVDRGKAEATAAGQAAEADRLYKLGEWGPAMALYEAERASRAALGDLRYEAYALRAIGLCRAELGVDDAAIESLRQAHRIDLKRDDPGYAGFDLFLIAQAELRLDRAPDAVKTLGEALPLLSQAVDRDHEADARLSLVRALVGLGRVEEARPHAKRAIALAEDLNDAWRLADAWASSGQVEGSLGRPSLALERFADARELFEQQGRAAEAAWMETVSGSTLLLLGRPDLALARYEEAARLHDHLDDGGSLSEDLAAVAGLQLDANKLPEALKAATLAVEKAQEADDRPREVEARVRLAQVQGRQGDWTTAAATLDEAVGLIRQVARDDPAEQIRLLLTAADVDRRAKLGAKSTARLDAAKRLAEESNRTDLQGIVEEARLRIEGGEGVPNLPGPDRTPKN